jgi:hypothetical protein
MHKKAFSGDQRRHVEAFLGVAVSVVSDPSDWTK